MAVHIDLIGAGPWPAGDHPEAAFGEHNRAVIIYAYANRPVSLDHLQEVMLAFDTAGFAVEMRAGQRVDQAHALYPDIAPVAGVVESHGIAVPVAEPADGPRR